MRQTTWPMYRHQRQDLRPRNPNCRCTVHVDGWTRERGSRRPQLAEQPSSEGRLRPVHRRRPAGTVPAPCLPHPCATQYYQRGANSWPVGTVQRHMRYPGFPDEAAPMCALREWFPATDPASSVGQHSRLRQLGDTTRPAAV